MLNFSLKKDVRGRAKIKKVSDREKASSDVKKVLSQVGQGLIVMVRG